MPRFRRREGEGSPATVPAGTPAYHATAASCSLCSWSCSDADGARVRRAAEAHSALHRLPARGGRGTTPARVLP